MAFDRLLERQIKRVLGVEPDEWSQLSEKLLPAAELLRQSFPTVASVLEKLPSLFDRISESYAQSERDIQLVRRSLELSSSELSEANQRLRDESTVTANALATLHDAFNVLLDGFQDEYARSSTLNLADISAKVLWLIREREQMRRALKESEERFDLAMQGANDGVWDWNLETGSVYFSPRWKQMIGYEDSEIADSPEEWVVRVHPDDVERVKSMLYDYLKGKRPAYESQFRFRHRNGEYLWILSRGRAVRDDQGKAIRLVGTHVDMTENKNAEVQLRIAKENAEKASQAKSEFLSSMSHELRTPMNAILGFGQVLCNDRHLSEGHRNAVLEILKAGRHLLTLINEVLDLAKVESGTLDVHLEAVTLAPLFEEIHSYLLPLAQKQEIKLVFYPPVNKAVQADPVRLKQVLLNLVSNAIKYNHPMGLVSISVEKGDKKSWRISVTDTGPGLSEEKQNQLFQPFNRLGLEGGTVQGTGIGLVITKKYVEGMGGRIGVTSRTGRGSIFWVELLQAEIDLDLRTVSAGHLESPQNVVPLSENLPRKKILYVDDNAINLILMEGLLEDRPEITLITQEDPRNCVSVATREKPDLIMLDIFMPGIDGFTLLKLLRDDEQLKSIPVVAVTANAMPHDVEKGKRAGFVDYITKPIEYPALTAVIDNLLFVPRQ